MRMATVKYYLTRFFCWILLLQMINISVDPPDIRILLQTEKEAEQSMIIEDLDTVYEIMAEALMLSDIPDDGDENDIEKSSKSVELFYYKPIFESFALYQSALLHNSYYADPLSVQPTEPFSPPPEQA
jgi:hypothetical protein